MPVLKNATCVAPCVDMCLCNACGILEVGMALLDCSEKAWLPLRMASSATERNRRPRQHNLHPNKVLARDGSSRPVLVVQLPISTHQHALQSLVLHQMLNSLNPSKATLFGQGQQVLLGSRQDCVCCQHQSRSLGLCWD